jgi:TonB family protein
MSLLSLLNWMLLSTALLGAWWLCYRLALCSERSFAYNRAFLVLGPLLAVGLPLLPLAWPAGWWGPGPAGLASAAAVLLPAAEVAAEGAVAHHTAADWPFWLSVAYWAGVGLILARLLLELATLWRASRRLPRTAQAGYTLVETHGRLPTSSFGRLVFWDETLPLSPTEARQVLCHELAHVRQGHTYDRLLLELLRAVLWFNPFVHRCGRALALTHEYLADAAALRDNAPDTPSHSYSQLLARQVASRLGFSVPLAHSFSYSQTLSRIAMIQKTNPVRRWKQWLALPLLGLLLVAVACEKAAPPAAPAASATSPNAVAPPPPPAVYESVEQMPELPGGGGPEAIVRDIQQHLDYPSVAPASRKDGTSFVSFIVTEKGEVQAVKVLKSLGAEYDAAVVAAIEKLPTFVPGRKAGKPVAVSYTVPIRFVWKATVRVANSLPLGWQGWAVEAPGAGC